MDRKELAKKRELVFTDIDGSKYFRDEHGDIRDEKGFLVPLEVEAHLQQLAKE